MCGIVALFNVLKAAELTAVGLHIIQHRAREYAGIVASDGDELYVKHGKGLVWQAFKDAETLDLLHGRSALGHIRYSTSSDVGDKHADAQPLVGTYQGKRFALAHNGNITNVDELSKLVPAKRIKTGMDTEYVLRLLEMENSGDIERDLRKVLPKLKGSVTIAILLPDKLVVVVDGSANRPLTIGTIDDGYVVASETCAITNIGGTVVKDVPAGSIVTFDSNGCRITTYAKENAKKCCFEHIYYANPASVVWNVPVQDFRRRMGALLQLYCPADADVVTAVPDSAIDIAEGYGSSGRSGVYERLILRSHTVGRTFIASTQARRDIEAARKFIMVGHRIAGKRIVVVDDSIVRGTTLKQIVGKLRELGAREVHVRSGSPAIIGACRYGIDTQGKELVRAHMSEEELCKEIGADSIGYLPIEALRSLYKDPDDYCFACMNLNYWD